MSATHVIAPWDGSEARLLAASELYAQVFAEPPYFDEPDESRVSFRERVMRYADTKPNFRLLLAWVGDDLTGLVLGSGIVEGDWWRDRITEHLSPGQRAEWLRDECFSVAELAVAPLHRGRGTARALMDAVIDALPYETAVLGCHLDAHPARRLYASLGWQPIIEGHHIGASPELCLLGKRLA